MTADSAKVLRYAVVGDSYSIGEGATEAESWPALLARSLTTSGIPVELVSNPARTGWTTRDALEQELPVFRAARPISRRVMIGVNDWVQDVEPEVFRQRLAQLIDEMLAVLPNEKRMLVVNIPDFSVTPDGPTYARGRDISAGLAGFNEIIAEEARKRGLPVVDIFPLSKRMGEDRHAARSRRVTPIGKGLRGVGAAYFSRRDELLHERRQSSSGEELEIATRPGRRARSPRSSSLISWTKLAAPAPLTTR